MDEYDRGTEITPLTVAVFLARYAPFLLGVPIAAAMFSLILSLVLGTGWVSRSVFSPQVRGSVASGLASVAVQFGIVPGGLGGSESVEFYSQLLRSRDLQRAAVLEQNVWVEPGGDTVRARLVDLWGAGEPNSEASIRAAVARLDRAITITTSREAFVVSLETRAAKAALAIAVNRRLLDLVNEFNLEKRKTRASAEREFTQTRMLEAQRELERAEAAERGFLEQNREYQSSPQLRFEALRLNRRTQLRQQVYLSLAQAFEQARIDEVRDTPVITVVQGPENAVRRARSRVVDALVWGLVALTVTLGIALVVENFRRERDHGSDAWILWRAVVAEVPLLGRLRRWLRPQFVTRQ